MTPAERDNPKIINGSRRARIARGSGTTTTEVNQLLDRFEAAQKAMRQVRRGMGVPGLGIPGTGKKKAGRGSTPRVKKGKSGNPAKRAQQEREALERMLGGGTSKAPTGASFGLGGGQLPTEEELKNLQLPPGLGGLFGR